MKKALVWMLLAFSLSVPAGAAEFVAPEVPASGMEAMPERTDSFGDGLSELLEKGLAMVQPELKQTVEACSGMIVSALLFSVLSILSEKAGETAAMAGAVAIGTFLFQHTGTLIRIASEAVREICEYGTLLCPVLTAALAAQGGITASAALYSGTILFISALSTLVTGCIVPMVYVFLLFSVASCAVGEDLLRNFADSTRRILSWLLKTLLIVFTTYISVTGVVSGTTDAAALKAAKLTISSAVPVVGGILSDASESVLVSMGIMKNTAGIYGILAVLAVFTGPFVKVGVQYLLLKGSGAICSLFGNKKISVLLEDFSAAMGLLLAMVAAGCVMVLVSTVCFLRGFGS